MKNICKIKIDSVLFYYLNIHVTRTASFVYTEDILVVKTLILRPFSLNRNNIQTAWNMTLKTTSVIKKFWLMT